MNNIIILNRNSYCEELSENLSTKIRGTKSIEVRIKREKVKLFTDELQSIIFDYNAVKAEHYDGFRSIIKRQLEIAGENKDDAEIDEMINAGTFQTFNFEVKSSF